MRADGDGRGDEMAWDGIGWVWQAGRPVSVSCACVTVSPVEHPSVGVDGLANPGCCGWRPVRQAT